MTGPLVTPDWLRERLGDPALQIVDCRYRLGERGAGEALWREAHIPGAAFMDLDRDLAGPPGERGRHPLPEAAAFQAAARRAGIGGDTLVVAYDEAAEGGAARLWWLLRHLGHTNVTVLDGGLRGWRDEGGELRGGDEEIEPGDFRAAAPADEPASPEELGHADGGPILLDARVPERYRGEVEPIDPVAGRIPGAVNWPFAEASRVPAAIADAGELVVYCGSGITACVDLLALARAGRPDAKLYPGSWSDWCGRGLPAERG